MFMCIYIYIYTYIHIYPPYRAVTCPTASLRTKIQDFRGFDSSVILIVKCGISRSVGSFPESLNRAILV